MQRLMVIEKEREVRPEDNIVGLRRLICSNAHTHRVCVVRYGDGSIWVFCPYFGYIESGLGCKIRRVRCRYFKAT